LSYRPLIF